MMIQTDICLPDSIHTPLYLVPDGVIRGTTQFVQEKRQGVRERARHLRIVRHDQAVEKSIELCDFLVHFYCLFSPFFCGHKTVR